jgi:hypothetical protein
VESLVVPLRMNPTEVTVLSFDVDEKTNPESVPGLPRREGFNPPAAM